MQLLSSKASGRIFLNRWTKTFLFLALFQVLISMTLLIIIAVNVMSYGGIGYPAQMKMQHVRIEVIWFMLFEVWRLWLVIDALIHCSSLTVITSGVLNLFSAGFGATGCLETSKMLATSSYNNEMLKMNLTLQTLLTGAIGLLFIPTTYVVYKLSLEYGWKTYRKVGAHITVQSMYFTVSCFSLILRIDTFFQVFIMIFYTVLGIIDGDPQSWIPGVMALLCLFGLFLARKAVSDENHWEMGLFLAIQLGFIGINGWMMSQHTDMSEPWYIILFYASTAILMTIFTLAFAIKCEINFGRGLKSFVHWSLFGKQRPVTSISTTQNTLLDDSDIEYTGYTVSTDLQQAILKQNRSSTDMHSTPV
ncbi:hypothetical protein BCR42DRAFT_419472 [Absidia repens]|uniref:Uncharacterized protein n=1 Tax=Absidia repens TaxID=90262 RepID=A0A1X2IBB5_9FUNG|nr:hypothetical protein BCR42DRAFT_419472 [Absidia repens]